MFTLRSRSADPTRTGMWRSRWAAIGAAVAVSFGAGGMLVVQAAPGASESTIVTVTPERIMDTRDPVNVGLAGPFVSPVSQKLQVTGSVPTTTGTKIVVPAGATGVLLNVTAVGPSAAGFISIRPGDATGVPATSSLNVTAGQNLPNAVQVALPTAGANAGKIDITFDSYGVVGPTTDILIDVVGYMTNTGLQQLVADVALKANTADVNAGLATKANTTALPIARSARKTDVIPDPNGTARVLVSVTINAPVAGIIQMVGSTANVNFGAAQSVLCWLTTGAGVTSSFGGGLANTYRRDFVAGSQEGSCSTNGALAVAAGTHILNLVSDAPTLVNLLDTTLDAIFVPGGTVTAT